MNYGKFYDDFVPLLTRGDREEINNMPKPNYEQVKRVNNYITYYERNFYKYNKSEMIQFNCWVYFKLFIKCYESSPEYYI